MATVYEFSKLCDVQEYEGFAWEDEFKSVRGQPEATMDFCPEFVDGGPDREPVRLASLWKPVRVIGNVRAWNDFPSINLDIPAFSRRAVEALRDLLEPNGELLSLISDVGEFFAYNVTTVADALDADRSEVTWGHDRLYASRIHRYEFDPDRLKGLVIFRLRQKMLDYYVTETFAQRVREHKLQGFDLAKVWPLPPGADWWRMRMDRLKRWARQAKQARRNPRVKSGDEPPLEPWKDI